MGENEQPAAWLLQDWPRRGVPPGGCAGAAARRAGAEQLPGADRPLQHATPHAEMAHVVDGFLDGFNATVMAVGRVLAGLAALAAGGAHVKLRGSYLELYNDRFSDLLAPATRPAAGLKRRVAATQMNDRSSRSHAIFTLALEVTTLDACGVPQWRASRLRLVDLAGSERAKRSGAEGDRLREAANINSR